MLKSEFKYNKEETVNALCGEKIIAIIRGVEQKDLFSVLRALYDGGVRAVEFPFGKDEETTARLVSEAVEQFGHSMYIGAGTVIDSKRYELALSAGARYLITPMCDLALAEACKALGVCSIIGALTPTEIKEASNAGADFVKIFPANTFGPSYIKAVSVPLEGIKLAAFGGINSDNMADYFNAGAVLAGIGSDLVDKKAIEERRFDVISEKAARYVQIAKAHVGR